MRVCLRLGEVIVRWLNYETDFSNEMYESKMEFVIDCLYSIQNDEPPANQQGLPQYYREQIAILHDVIKRLTKMLYSIESSLEELET